MLPPEAELLLKCCQPAPSEQDRERIRELLERGIDWQEFERLGRYHQVSPLSYQCLTSSFESQVPGEVLTSLAERQEEVSRHNQALARELVDLLALFRRHSLAAIPFKGPVLAAAVYGSLGARFFRDLDILVEPTDFLRAQKLLESEGYAVTKQFDWESTLRHPERAVSVDLHRDLSLSWFSAPIEFQQLWRNTREVDLTDGVVRGFSPADRLLLLCTQLCADWVAGQRKLLKLRDIDGSVRAWPDPNWADLLREARRVDARGILLLGLALSQAVLGTPLPPVVRQQLRAFPDVLSLAADAPRVLFDARERTPLADRLVIYWRLRERIRARLVYGLEIAKIRIGDEGRKPGDPWPAKLLLHSAIRPAWHLWWSTRRLMKRWRGADPGASA